MKTWKWILLTALLVSAPWRTNAAGGVVVVTDSRVAQYREAVAAINDQATVSAQLDLASGDVGSALVAAAPDVVLAVGAKAVAAAQAATPQLPLVYCMVLGTPPARSPRVTGVLLEVDASVQINQIRRVHPRATRVGVFYDQQVSGPIVAELAKVARSTGLSLVQKPVSDPKAVRAALGELLPAIDVLLLVPDARLITAEMFTYILGTTLERKVALFGFLDSLTQAGALASLSPDYREIGKRAAKLASEIAGRTPAARAVLPQPVSNPGALTINAKTAKLLGLDIPEAVLSTARHVYR